MEEIRPHPDADRHLIVSIAAGVSLRQLAEGLGTRRLVRVMPNTPCLVGATALAYTLRRGRHGRRRRRWWSGLLKAVGVAFRVPERLLAP